MSVVFLRAKTFNKKVKTLRRNGNGPLHSPWIPNSGMLSTNFELDRFRIQDREPYKLYFPARLALD